MTSRIKLSDIDVAGLPTQTLNLLAQVTTRLRKLSGRALKFSDPRVLEKISYEYKRVDNPEVTSLYKQYKAALKEYVNLNRSGMLCI